MTTRQPFVSGVFSPAQANPSYVTLQGLSRYVPVLYFDQQVPLAASGKLLHLKVRVTTPPPAGGSMKFTVVVDGVDTDLTCTINAGETEASCTNKEISVTEGQKAYMRMNPTGISPVGNTWITLDFAGTNDGEGMLLSSQYAGFSSGNWFYGILGACSSRDNIESYTWMVCPIAGTVSRLRVGVSKPLGAGITGTFTFRKNSASTSLSCQISGAVQQEASDLNDAHSVSVAAGDAIVMLVHMSGTPLASTYAYFSMKFTANVDGWSIIGGGATFPRLSGSIDNFTCPNAFRLAAATSDGVRLMIGNARIQNFFVRLSGAAGFICTIRVNGVDTAVVVTIPSMGSSGNNIVDYYDASVGDLVSIKWRPTSGAEQYARWGLGCYALYTPPPPAKRTPWLPAARILASARSLAAVRTFNPTRLIDP